MTSKRSKRSGTVGDLKPRGIKSDAAGKREGNAVRGGATKTLPKGTQIAPSQTKVIVSG
jgi:hypothetical protein